LVHLKKSRITDLSLKTILGEMMKEVREDIRRILRMPKEEFDEWYEKRRKLALRLRDEFKLLAEIPCMQYSYATNFGAYATVSAMLEMLEEVIESLGKIKEIYYNIHTKEGNASKVEGS